MSAHQQRPLAQPRHRLHHNPTSRQHQAQGVNDGGPASNSHRTSSDEETAEELSIRCEAARILANYEQLVWLSVARNESIVQTRLHFEALLAGLPCADPDPYWPTEYQTAHKTSQAKSPVGKGKARVASDSHNRTTVEASSSSTKKKDKEKERSKGSSRGA